LLSNKTDARANHPERKRKDRHHVQHNNSNSNIQNESSSPNTNANKRIKLEAGGYAHEPIKSETLAEDEAYSAAIRSDFNSNKSTKISKQR
jgi:hypothetical protein